MLTKCLGHENVELLFGVTPKKYLQTPASEHSQCFHD